MLIGVNYIQVILLLCLFPHLIGSQPTLPQKDIQLPQRTINDCFREIYYETITYEDVEEALKDENIGDTCLFLLVATKMRNDWEKVMGLDRQIRGDQQLAYFDYWTSRILNSALLGSFNDFLLDDFYCANYWRGQVEHQSTEELCDGLLFDNGTNLVDAAYLRVLLLDKKLKHIHRIHGCSREYTSGLFYLVNLQYFFLVDNAFGGYPLMDLKSRMVFYNAAVSIGECQGFTKEVWERFNLGGEVKHLFVKD
jgi:hypothetical protein